MSGASRELPAKVRGSIHPMILGDAVFSRGTS